MFVRIGQLSIVPQFDGIYTQLVNALLSPSHSESFVQFPEGKGVLRQSIMLKVVASSSSRVCEESKTALVADKNESWFPGRASLGSEMRSSAQTRDERNTSITLQLPHAFCRVEILRV